MSDHKTLPEPATEFEQNQLALCVLVPDGSVVDEDEAMAETKKRILVVGGGFTGIGSIKSLKEEGFEPVCYEKESQFGGTWRYREEAREGLPSIMPTTIINHSKEMGAFSDYVPDKNYPNYMRHDQLLHMLEDIGKRFDCFRHMVFNREVVKVRRSADYDSTGRWDVTVKNTLTGDTFEEVYDAVILGVGQFSYPRSPDFPGLEKFKGTVLHTHSLKGVEKFRQKKVVVVGIGCSGLDAAVEVSNVASKVYMSTRTGTWVIPRLGSFGLPFDYIMLRRIGVVIQALFGYKYASKVMEDRYISPKFNHNLYNLRPAYSALGKDPSINDYLPMKLITGAIQIRKDVKCFTEQGVMFENESHITEVDTVIMATGYDLKMPFLEEGIITKEDGRINLYQCVFPPHLKHPTLATIGYILPWGAGFPLGDIQCRWVARVFGGHVTLPSKEVMVEEIVTRHNANVERYAPSDKTSIRVDYIQYQDAIADLIGAKPNFTKLLFTDFELFWALCFGPSLPYQYRLQGPHKWDGARKAILTAHERVRCPLSGEYKKETKPKNVPLSLYFKYFAVFLCLALWLQFSERSVKCYLVALILPYLMTWKGFYRKYFFCLMMLPFFVPWTGFVSSYFVTLMVPIFIAYL